MNGHHNGPKAPARRADGRCAACGCHLASDNRGAFCSPCERLRLGLDTPLGPDWVPMDWLRSLRSPSEVR